jgi:hypothetical protein
MCLRNRLLLSGCAMKFTTRLFGCALRRALYWELQRWISTLTVENPKCKTDLWRSASEDQACFLPKTSFYINLLVDCHFVCPYRSGSVSERRGAPQELRTPWAPPPWLADRWQLAVRYYYNLNRSKEHRTGHRRRLLQKTGEIRLHRIRWVTQFQTWKTCPVSF